MWGCGGARGDRGWGGAGALPSAGTGAGTGAGVGAGRPGPGEGGMTDVLGGPGDWGAAAGGGVMMLGDLGRHDVRR